MNSALLISILNLVLSAIPQISSSKILNQLVSTLLNLEPAIQQFYADVAPIIQNIIAALSANPASTATQLAVLKQLDAQVDKSFDDAFAAWTAAHPVTGGAAPLSQAG